MVFRSFPELYKYWRQDFTRKRCLIGFVVIGALSLTLMSSLSSRYYPGNLSEEDRLILVVRANLSVFLTLLYVITAGFGAMRIAQGIGREISQQTWDLQRLTPVNAFEMAIGKLWGPLLFPLFLGLCFAPWILGLYLYSGGLGFEDFYVIGLRIAYVSAFSWTLALLLSSYGRYLKGRFASEGILLLPLFFFMSTIYTTKTGPIDYSFLGGELSSMSLAYLYILFFGFWCFWAAKWQIGEEFLEAAKAWRIPLFLFSSFLFFLFQIKLGASAYSKGINTGLLDFENAFKASYLLTIPIVLIHSATAEKWREWWVFAKKSRFVHETPRNILCLVALLGLFAVTLPFQKSTSTTFHFMAIILRDTLLIQLIFLTRGKNHTVFSAIILSLRYAIPAMLSSVGIIRSMDSLQFLSGGGFSHSNLPGLLILVAEILIYGFFCARKITAITSAKLA